METIEKRKYFRLDYKMNGLMPSIKTSSGEYKVPEISERGLKLLVRNVDSFRIGLKVRGTLNLKTGALVVEGRVLRILGNEVVLELSDDKSISFKQMLDEQRYLRVMHPTVFPKQNSNTELSESIAL